MHLVTGCDSFHVWKKSIKQLVADYSCVFSGLSWLLGRSGRQEALSELQEPAACGQTPTSVRLLQQNRKAHGKWRRGSTISFHAKVKLIQWNSVHCVLHRFSGWRSTRRLHSVWSCHWWRHDPGYHGRGTISLFDLITANNSCPPKKWNKTFFL